MKRKICLLICLLTCIISFAQGKQYIKIQVTPVESNVVLDGKSIQTRNGKANVLVDMGKHYYSVSCDSYYSQKGEVVIYSKEEAYPLSLSLIPNFGWLDIVMSVEPVGDTSYIIDGSPIQNLSNIRLASGEHTLTVTNPYYKPSTYHFLIKDEEKTKVRVQLNKEYSNVIFEGDANTTYNIRGVNLGNLGAIHNIKYGHYVVEASRAGYESCSSTFDIMEMTNDTIIKLPVLKPVFGSIAIDTYPSEASIFLDGQLLGNTPLYRDSISAETHNLKITKQGYNAIEKEVVVLKDSILELSENLSVYHRVPYGEKHPEVYSFFPKEGGYIETNTGLGKNITWHIGFGYYRPFANVETYLGTICNRDSQHYVVGYNGIEYTHKYDRYVGKSFIWGIRYGLPVHLAPKFLLLPQVGYELHYYTFGNEIVWNSSNIASNLTINAKLLFDICRHWGFTINPRYTFQPKDPRIHDFYLVEKELHLNKGFSVEIGIVTNF